MTTARSLAIALGFAGALALVYVLLIRTATGQVVDTFGAFASLHDRLGGGVKTFRTLAPILLAIGAVGLAVLALVRRRFADAVRAVVIGLGSIGAGEIMKYLLPRPFLGDHGYVDNTFPSGHTTLAVSAALAVAVLVPRRARAVVVPIVMVTAVIAAWASIVSYAHRPSDVLGGALVVGMVGAPALRGRRPSFDGHPVAAGAVVLLALASVVPVIAAISTPNSALAGFGWTAATVAAVGLVATLTPSDTPEVAVSPADRRRPAR